MATVAITANRRALYLDCMFSSSGVYQFLRGTSVWGSHARKARGSSRVRVPKLRETARLSLHRQAGARAFAQRQRPREPGAVPQGAPAAATALLWRIAVARCSFSEATAQPALARLNTEQQEILGRPPCVDNGRTVV